MLARWVFPTLDSLLSAGVTVAIKLDRLELQSIGRGDRDIDGWCQMVRKGGSRCRYRTGWPGKDEELHGTETDGEGDHEEEEEEMQGEE
jgi:hypothetical protein